MGGSRLLYFLKCKNGTKCKNFAILLCFNVNTCILLCYLRWQEGRRATAPLATPLNPPLHPHYQYFHYNYSITKDNWLQRRRLTDTSIGIGPILALYGYR